MKLLIRADMNDYIATGHIMRCIPIAKVAEKTGMEVKFISADENGRSIIENQGFEYICLDGNWDNLDNELDKLVAVIREQEVNCMLIDSYYVTENYLSVICKECYVAYIDDLNMFKYPCHMLICYANYYKKFRYEELYHNNIRLLSGCAYAPLRACFSKLEYKGVSGEVKEILVLSGGTDRFHFVKSFLKICSDNRNEIGEVHVTAVCGMYNQDYGELSGLYSKAENISVMQSLNNIDIYMQKADLVISAGGITLYELCACGTPTICYTFADNQLDNAMSFENDDIMIYAGDLRKSGTIDKVFDSVINLMKNYDKRVAMSNKMREIVDGHGAERIVEELRRNTDTKGEENDGFKRISK